MDRFTASLYMHVTHLNRELSLHHPPGNHLLAEASVLLCLSLLYPLFSDSSRRVRDAAAILNRLVPLLILPDGVYAEQSTGYFRFVCEALFPVIIKARARGISLSPVVEERLAAGLKWIMALAPDPHNVPMIGDGDTGSAVGWGLVDFRGFRPLLAVGGVMFGRRDMLGGIPELPAEAYLMLGMKSLDGFRSLIGDSSFIGRGRQAADLPPLPGSAPRSVSFPHGGYEVSADSHFHVVFDGGPLGLSPGCGHGHADGLSWIMSFDGQPVVVDTGTGLYNGPQIGAITSGPRMLTAPWQLTPSGLSHRSIPSDGPARPKSGSNLACPSPADI